MAQHFSIETRVREDLKGEMEVDSMDLVPGDLIKVKVGQALPCDMIVVQGNCTVDENMLTGESRPVLKVAYKDAIEKQNILSGGTQILQKSDEECVARIHKVGYLSAKGAMIREMLLIEESSFSLYLDAIRFLLVMAGISLVLILLTFKPMLDQNYSTFQMTVRLLDILTIAVPPALPSSLTAVTIFSLARLSKNQIFCRSPPKVMFAGRVKTIVFDKTGTLTEERFEGVCTDPASLRIIS